MIHRSSIIWIGLLQLIIYWLCKGNLHETAHWSRNINLSSPMFSPDGQFVAFKAGVVRDNILERRLLIVDVQKWQPVYQLLVQRRKLTEGDIKNGDGQELSEEYQRYGFTWLDAERLAYFDLEGKLWFLDVKGNPARPEHVWQADRIYRVVASHKGGYVAVICKIPEFPGVACVIIDTKSKSIIHKHGTSMTTDPYPVASFSADDRWLAVSDGELIDVIDLAQKQFAQQINCEDDVVVALTFGPAPNSLLALTYQGNIYFCDYKRGTISGSTQIGDLGELAALKVLTVDGRKLLMAWNESDITLYDLDKLKICWTKALPNYGCAVSPDHRTIMVVTSDRQISLMSLLSGKVIEKMP
ncbi:hypothetical protein HRbin36_00638 [bacterium HR36]|nr:hypothetical protein HRbin36_00638 [bacterium HR36]